MGNQSFETSLGLSSIPYSLENLLIISQQINNHQSINQLSVFEQTAHHPRTDCPSLQNRLPITRKLTAHHSKTDCPSLETDCHHSKTDCPSPQNTQPLTPQKNPPPSPQQYPANPNPPTN